MLSFEVITEDMEPDEMRLVVDALVAQFEALGHPCVEAGGHTVVLPSDREPVTNGDAVCRIIMSTLLDRNVVDPYIEGHPASGKVTVGWWVDE